MEVPERSGRSLRCFRLFWLFCLCNRRGADQRATGVVGAAHELEDAVLAFVARQNRFRNCHSTGESFGVPMPERERRQRRAFRLRMRAHVKIGLWIVMVARRKADAD